MEPSIVDEDDEGAWRCADNLAVETPDGHTIEPQALLAGRTNAAALDSTAIFSLLLLRLIFRDLHMVERHDEGQNLAPLATA